MLKDITDYGTVNTAGGDWTAAIQAMANDGHSNSYNAGGDLGHVVLPPGKGYYNGTPLALYNLSIEGRSPWHTILTCTTPLVNIPNLVNLNLQKFSIFGGTNPIQIGTATDNGGRYRVINNVEFHGHSGTAIKITGSDTPYFDIRRCTFDGAAGSTGISMAGYTDNSVIDHNEFRSYKIGMKLSGVMQRIKVSNNNFMHVGETSSAPHYDTWITPSPNAGGLASGIGATFEGNWHGSEGRSTTDWFFVIADDTSGLPNLVTPSTGYLSGVTIRDSGAFYVGAATPYIFTTVTGAKLQFNDFGESCRRYLAAEAYGGPMLQLLAGDPDPTNRVRQWMDLYHDVPVAGGGSPITPLPTNFVDGAVDSTGEVSATWMNSVGDAINTLASG